MQSLQLGLLPDDPLKNLSHPELKPQIRTKGRYLFDLLQAIVQDFDHIRDTAEKEGRNLEFANPRELLSLLCDELDQITVPSEVETFWEYLELYIDAYFSDISNPLPHAEINETMKDEVEKAGYQYFLFSILLFQAEHLIKEKVSHLGMSWMWVESLGRSDILKICLWEHRNMATLMHLPSSKDLCPLTTLCLETFKEYRKQLPDFKYFISHWKPKEIDKKFAIADRKFKTYFSKEKARSPIARGS